MRHTYLFIALLCAIFANAQQLETVNVNGKSRTMMVYTPKGLTDDRPLVISLHGANQDAAYQRDQTKWNNCADTAKIVVVYPNAINKFWDTGGQSDIAFISWIIDTMYDRYKINRNRVYITGFSLGAMMTYHCMEHLGNKVAAFGPVSGVRFDNRAPTAPRRVPFIHTHGTGDDVFRWTGDPGHAAGGYPYIPTYVEKWATYEGLTVKEEISPYPANNQNSIATMTTWRSDDPNDNIEIALLTLKDKGHWHSEDIASGVSTTQEIWRFCKRYSLQPEAPKLVGAVPEDKSFDMTSDMRDYSLSFSELADINAVNASLSCGDNSIKLHITETENSKTLTLSVPDTETIADGEYTLTVSGLRNPEGGDDNTATLTYYYGPSEYGDQIKEAFAKLYEHSIEVYVQTDGATAMSIINARSRLKKYIDKYSDFVSTSPSDYKKATENLQKNLDILEPYLDSLGISTVSNDVIVTTTRYFDIDGKQICEPQPGVTVVVKQLNNGETRIDKTYRK